MKNKKLFQRIMVYALVMCMFAQSMAMCFAAADGDIVPETPGAGNVVEDSTNVEPTEAPEMPDAEPEAPTEAPEDSKEIPVEEMTLAQFKDILGTYNINDDVLSYKEYIQKYTDTKTSQTIVIPAVDYYKDASDMELSVEENSSYEGTLRDAWKEEGQNSSLLTDEDGFVSWKFTAPETGYYYLSTVYYPVSGKNAAIERAFFIDGKLPYAEMTSVEFSRIWMNSTVTYDTAAMKWAWQKDNQGNDGKPSQKEAPDWMNTYLFDSNGYISKALPIYLEAGEHVLTMVSIKEPMLLYRLQFDYVSDTISYSEYKAQHDALGHKDAPKNLIEIQAEHTVRKSSQMLYPQQDQSSPAVYPYSARYLLNNTIGGNSWRMVGQWIEWDFSVPADGYYELSLAVRQNFSKGIYVSRKISIDGEVPFDEFNAYGFEYEQSWHQETLGDSKGNPYSIYLEAGAHTIRMEVVLGEFSSIVADVQEAVSQLNAIYREILCITGTNPDAWKDYQIERNLPDLEEKCVVVRDLLNDTIKRLQDLVGKGSDKETVLITMRDQLDDIIEDVEYVVKVVSTFRTNIRACGTWITQVIEQPLALDALYVASSDAEVPEMNDSWWRKLIHEIKRLFYSFIIDYNMIGDVSDGENTTVITLWIGTGRDQANVIKDMLDETFSPKTYVDKNGKDYHVSVNVMLVDINTLLQATLAGSGPDVAIQVANDWPMNYGLRNAVADLTQFEDCEQTIAERFRPSAMEAFTFEHNGEKRIYGLPETQTFAMMFYRKDILKELELELPTTWDEMKVVLTVLSQNNMDLGMMPTESNFAMLLYQNGGEYYNADGSLSMLDAEEGVTAFRKFTEFYTDFGMDTVTSVEERFRTGEAPIIITDYTYYNTLQVSAPDIQGLWGMAVVPGEVRTDANGKEYVDNTVASAGTACVIMEASEHKQACWEFLKWWTSAETQYKYSCEMESLMGASARVATANIEAFGLIPWPADIAEVLEVQFENVRGIRQVPGGYFTWRNVNNAFYAVTTQIDSATPREELMDRVIDINDEIAYKRKEFHLDD